MLTSPDHLRLNWSAEAGKSKEVSSNGFPGNNSLNSFHWVSGLLGRRFSIHIGIWVFINNVKEVKWTHGDFLACLGWLRDHFLTGFRRSDYWNYWQIYLRESGFETLSLRVTSDSASDPSKSEIEERCLYHVKMICHNWFEVFWAILASQSAEDLVVFLSLAI